MTDFGDFLGALEEDIFDEKPVTIEEFTTSKDFLGLPPLSEIQYQIVRAGSQIYRLDTLIDLYGLEEGQKRYDETFNEVILQLGKACHAPYTPVFDPQTGQWTPLNEFVSDGKVISFDGQSHYATEAFQEGYGKMLRVKTSAGFVEDVYVGHKYLSYSKSRYYHRYRGYKPEFKCVNDIKIGDQIAIGIDFDVDQPVNIAPEHAELVGYWLGDGMLPTDKQPILNMDFCADETESIKRYEELCNIIGDKPYKFNHKIKNMTIFRHGRNSKAVTLARELGLWGMRSKDKRVPDCVHASNNDIIKLVVEKLWQTDGCVYKKGNGYAAEFCSVSSVLANDVHRMLLRLGVPSFIRSKIPSSNFDNVSEAWYVSLTGNEFMQRFIDKIDLLDHKRISHVPPVRRPWKRIDGNVFYDKVVSIEELPDGEYWTKTVPDTGNYIGSGPVSANSGKDYTSTILCVYVVYLLLCLKDPAGYFGKPKDDNIDILNIAINSDQAKNVFFKGFKNRLKNCPWFEGKYDSTQTSVEFDKSINVYSGHSEREAFEGLNLLIAVLDEISGFSLESPSGGESAKTASGIYNMYRASVDSRFAEVGKVLLLSFPRFKSDYIQQRYDAVVADKEIIKRSHHFKLDPDLPDGIEGNEFDVEWEEDHILRYKYPRLFALKRPSWEVNPTVKIDSPAMVRAFHSNLADALGRFACMPSDNVDATFFKNKEAIDDAFVSTNGVDEDGVFFNGLVPESDKEYYIHVDLAQKKDYCAVAMGHVDKWVKVQYAENTFETYPHIKIDLLRWWAPGTQIGLDFADVRNFIVLLRRKGFNIKLVTFDRWNSNDTMNYLTNEQGIKTDTLSVGNKHYDDFLAVMYDSRLIGPNEPLLIDELRQLRWIKGKVDHPRSGHKDLSDAVCGTIWNCAKHAKQPVSQEVEVRSLSDYKIYEEPKETFIKPPKRDMPTDLADFISRIRTL